jgi:nucleotidyltransferase substrate binding protein (TIGR01987 family)
MNANNTIDTTFLKKCITTLENAYLALEDQTEKEGLYDIYRAACVKEFELILEQSGKLLKKRLHAYFANNREADKLTFKDIFRYATKHTLMDTATCERWFVYRDNRNTTAHDYGENFAETTLKLIPEFIADARDLSRIIEKNDD